MLPNQVDIDRLLEHIIKVKGAETLDEQDKIIKAFYELYSEAYKELTKVNPDIPFHESAISTEKGTNRYTIFESFIKNCVIDCVMWHLGSGKISFAPYKPLFDFIFKGDVKTTLVRSKIIKSYIELELPEAFERKNSK